MATVGNVYIEKFQRKLDEFNHPRRLVSYLIPFIGDKDSVTIAELGAGPMNTIGDSLGGIEVKVIPSDILVSEYQELWEKHNSRSINEVEYQDMENLTYADESFDIVHCRNALDHTPDPYKAIVEMKRVCKKGGYVYLRHAPGQKTRYGGHHYHNFEELYLPEFETHIEDDLIVNIWKKT